jgi:hypothetical protein
VQPTNLNKAVSLFLIGGVVLLIIGFVSLPTLDLGKLAELLKILGDKGGSNLLAVVGGLLVLSASVVGGALSEAVADLTLRALLRRFSENRALAGLLLQKSVLKSYRSWKKYFHEVVAADQRFAHVRAKVRERGLASGIMYASGNAEIINSTQSDYSTFLMVSNLACLSLILEIYVPCAACNHLYSWHTALCCTPLLIAFAYALTSMALHRYLYSYHVSFRHASMAILWDQAAASRGCHASPVAEAPNPGGSVPPAALAPGPGSDGPGSGARQP